MDRRTPVSETNISWVARPCESPSGACSRGESTTCLDITCSTHWVGGVTINPWHGCARVSEACRHCYAEVFLTSRKKLDLWGPNKPRLIRVQNALTELRRLAKKATRENQRYGAFVGSMCDIGEVRPDLNDARTLFLKAVQQASSIDVMLLTKRIDTFASLVPWSLDDWPVHAWMGATVEDDREDVRRLPHLAKFHDRGAITFVSIEPMIGAGPNIRPWLKYIDLVIIGGESGNDARPFDVDAAHALVDLCLQAGVAVWFKQMGSVWANQFGGALVLGASHGQDPYRWPEWARLHQLPTYSEAAKKKLASAQGVLLPVSQKMLVGR